MFACVFGTVMWLSLSRSDLTGVYQTKNQGLVVESETSQACNDKGVGKHNHADQCGQPSGAG